MSKDEWEKYSALQAEGSRFETVSHITTPDAAAGIVGQRKIRALLSDRQGGEIAAGYMAPVVWMSPNVYQESKFGTVMFNFRWRELIEDRSAYWIPDAGSINRQILLSKRTCWEQSRLVRYDPKSAKGPWIQKGENHYHDKEGCVRFLFDEDIRVDSGMGGISSLAFTDADGSVDGPTDRNEAAALFLGRLLCLVQRPSIRFPTLLNDDQTLLTPALATAVKTLIERIESPLRQKKAAGRVAAEDCEAKFLAAALLCTRQTSWRRAFSPFHELVTMFTSPSAAANAIRALLKARLDVPELYEPDPSLEDLI